MSQIASKNLYDLLGNDPELDPDREPEPPPTVVDKPVQRTGKRNAGAEGSPRDTPRPAGGGRGGRHQEFGRADQAGSLNNRAEQRDDGVRQDRHPDRTRDPRDHRDIGNRGRGSRGGRGRGRGFEGRGTRTARDDRHSHTGIGEHEKQAEKGWGAENDGQAEWSDEKAGEAIANAEVKDEPGLAPDTNAADPAFTNGPSGEEQPVSEEPVAAPEAEDKTMSYDQYLAQQAEKRLALGGSKVEMRKANEGSKSKFPEGTAIAREEQDFFVGAGGKAKREKENKQKDVFVIEGQYYAPAESGDRGGRGRGRGRGRGEGPRGDRGRGRGRGDFRGGFRGDRDGPPRGGARGGARGGFNTQDETAFPALGGN